MTLYWTAGIVMIGLWFAIGETYALMHNKTTLSRWVWNVSKAFPAFPWIVGIVTGFVASHFWWGGAFSCFAPPT